MKTYVCILYSMMCTFVQYAGPIEEEAKDLENHEDYDMFDDESHFELQVWENRKLVETSIKHIDQDWKLKE